MGRKENNIKSRKQSQLEKYNNKFLNFLHKVSENKSLPTVSSDVSSEEKTSYYTLVLKDSTNINVFSIFFCFVISSSNVKATTSQNKQINKYDI